MGKFGRLIKKIRISSDKTLREVAEVLEVGVSYLSDVEQGRRKPFTPDLIGRFAGFVGADEDELRQLAMKERRQIEIPVNKGEQVNVLAYSLARADTSDFEDSDVAKTMDDLIKALERKRK